MNEGVRSKINVLPSASAPSEFTDGNRDYEFSLVTISDQVVLCTPGARCKRYLATWVSALPREFQQKPHTPASGKPMITFSSGCPRKMALEGWRERARARARSNWNFAFTLEPLYDVGLSPAKLAPR